LAHFRHGARLCITSKFRRVSGDRQLCCRALRDLGFGRLSPVAQALQCCPPRCTACTRKRAARAAALPSESFGEPGSLHRGAQRRLIHHFPPPKRLAGAAAESALVGLPVRRPSGGMGGHLPQQDQQAHRSTTRQRNGCCCLPQWNKESPG
jgi:hypothetical protein